MSVIDRSANIRRLAQQLRQFGRLAIGRVLGTVSTDDGRYKFFMNAEERGLFLRAEVNAFVGLLIRKGIVTEAEWGAALEQEFEQAIAGQRKVWPEVTSIAEDGQSIELDVAKLLERTKRERWPA